jgi:catechol 2,3-dioxygenase-like lactoylglutathione lyase family enzyme
MSYAVAAAAVVRDPAFVPTERGVARSMDRAPELGRYGVIEGLGYLWLEVSDLERSITFYRDGLRFAVDTGNRNGPSTAHLRAGELRLILSEATPSPRDCSHHGIAFTIEVSGVDAYHDALVARGLQPSAPHDDGTQRGFSLQDPDGYEWRFIQSTR